MRTVSNIEELLKPLDTIIDEKLLPALFNGRILNADERKLIALPTKLGGLGMTIPSEL